MDSQNYGLEKVTPALNMAIFGIQPPVGICAGAGWCRWNRPCCGFSPGGKPWFPKFFGRKTFRVKLVIHRGPVNHEGSTYFLVYHVVPGYGESQLTRFWMVCVWGLGFFSQLWFGAMVCFVDRWHPVQCRGGGLEQLKLDELSHHRERKEGNRIIFQSHHFFRAKLAVKLRGVVKLYFVSEARRMEVEELQTCRKLKQQTLAPYCSSLEGLKKHQASPMLALVILQKYQSSLTVPRFRCSQDTRKSDLYIDNKYLSRIGCNSELLLHPNFPRRLCRVPCFCVFDLFQGWWRNPFWVFWPTSPQKNCMLTIHLQVFPLLRCCLGLVICHDLMEFRHGWKRHRWICPTFVQCCHLCSSSSDYWQCFSGSMNVWAVPTWRIGSQGVPC